MQPRTSVAGITAAVLLASCGAAAVQAPTADTALQAPATDSAAFLLEVGASLSDLLARPTQSIEELDAARRAARGPDRLRAARDEARAQLFAAETSQGREQRAHYREMNELSTSSTRVRDEALSADLDFLALWAAWRSGQASADGRAQRFIAHHESSRDLVLIAWIIRGEVAFAAQRWDDALEGFRGVLGRLGHPLYGFALFRSAAVWREQGRDDDARQALREVRDLGCASDANPEAIHIALAATHALGELTTTGVDGHERPSSCAVSGAPTTSGPLEDERPPPVQ